jgi:GNAT superfamily N-acetyltransferase
LVTAGCVLIADSGAQVMRDPVLPESSPMPTLIRPARLDDGLALREIERLAGARFRDVGLPEVADDEPASFETLADYAEAGRSWVAVDDADAPIGYVLVDIVDECAHVEQISVLPLHQGVGTGRALLESVRAWAAERGLTAMTLTTFADVEWNAALYRHLGFRLLNEDELGPQLREVRESETAHGLDPVKRVCLRRGLRG